MIKRLLMSSGVRMVDSSVIKSFLGSEIDAGCRSKGNTFDTSLFTGSCSMATGSVLLPEKFREPRTIIPIIPGMTKFFFVLFIT
jgi:hypothetical protein